MHEAIQNVVAIVHVIAVSSPRSARTVGHADTPHGCEAFRAYTFVSGFVVLSINVVADALSLLQRR